MGQATFLGHSTVLIEADQKRIIIDPFLEGNPSCPVDLVDPGPIDWICLTHGHSDHASGALTLAQKYGSTVFATYELANLLIKDGLPSEQIQYLNSGGTVIVDGIQVTLTPAIHSSSYDSIDGNTYYAGVAGGIALKFSDQSCVYHVGDTALFSDLKLLGEELKPDLAFIPIGDRLTMGPKDAARAARLIRAKTVVPIHFATFPLLTGQPAEFVEAVGLSSKAIVLEPGQQISF